MESPLIAIGREAVQTALLVSAPPLLAALCVGLVVGLLQAMSQIQDPTLAVAPRVAAVLGALWLAGGFIGQELLRFAGSCLSRALEAAR